MAPLANRRIDQGIGVGGSSLPDTRPVSQTSLADLRSRFAARSPLPQDDASRLADHIPLLRRRHNEQQQCAKIQFVDPRLKLSSCRSLLLLARATVSVSQLVYQAVRSLDDATTAQAQPTVPPETIEEALAWNDGQIDRIARHMQVLDAADAHSAWLRALLGQLESSARVLSSDWTRLARDVISAASAGHDSDSALPLPGLMLKSYFAEIGQARHAEVVARGIEAARIFARMLPRRTANGFDPELLIVAALCQDCGLLLGQSQSASKATTAAQQLRSLHPSIGAGLVAGLVEFSTELPALVAQHHVRLNEPRLTLDFAARIQNRGSRLLAIIVRWLELIEDCSPAIADEEPPAGRLAFAQPAARLVRETLRGDWDRRLAVDLLAAWGFREESETLYEADRVVSRFENRDDVRRRVDTADEHWPAPNFELGPRSREIPHVRPSAR